MSLSSTLTICTLEECDKPAFSRSLCSKHYQQQRTHEKRYEGLSHVPVWQPDAVKRGRPASPYSADTVRKALASGKAPKCLTMASGKPTLGMSPEARSYVPTHMRDVAKRSAKGNTTSYRARKHAHGQQDCTVCRTDTHEEHLHSQFVKPQERSAHLEVKPASEPHFTTNLQTWGNGAGPAPRYELKRKDLNIVASEVQEPSDLRVKGRFANSELIQARLHGFDT